MWKIYLTLAIFFSAMSFLQWQWESKREWHYAVTYSFQGGIGRIFVTRSKPIESVDDIKTVERYITDKNENDGTIVQNLFVTRWKVLKP